MLVCHKAWYGTGTFRPYGLAVRHPGAMAPHPLTRGEITELADRLHGLLEMIAVDEMTATTGMMYRVQGAVVALDAVLGQDSSFGEQRPVP
jgi:hypothetical protein